MKDYMNLVEHILRKHLDARDDDFRLYGWAVKALHPEIMDMPFKQVMWQSSQLELPSYESITGCRRKLQEKKPELRGRKYLKRQGMQDEYIVKYGRRYS